MLRAALLLAVAVAVASASSSASVAASLEPADTQAAASLVAAQEAVAVQRESARAKTALDLVDAMAVANGDAGVAKALVAWKKCAEDGQSIYACDQALAVARRTAITAPGPAGDAKGSLGQALGPGLTGGASATGGATGGTWSSEALRASWEVQAKKLAVKKGATQKELAARRAVALLGLRATAVAVGASAAKNTSAAAAKAKDVVMTRVAEEMLRKQLAEETAKTDARSKALKERRERYEAALTNLNDAEANATQSSRELNLVVQDVAQAQAVADEKVKKAADFQRFDNQTTKAKLKDLAKRGRLLAAREAKLRKLEKETKVAMADAEVRAKDMRNEDFKKKLANEVRVGASGREWARGGARGREGAQGGAARRANEWEGRSKRAATNVVHFPAIHPLLPLHPSYVVWYITRLGRRSSHRPTRVPHSSHTRPTPPHTRLSHAHSFDALSDVHRNSVGPPHTPAAPALSSDWGPPHICAPGSPRAPPSAVLSNAFTHSLPLLRSFAPSSFVGVRPPPSLRSAHTHPHTQVVDDTAAATAYVREKLASEQRALDAMKLKLNASLSREAKLERREIMFKRKKSEDEAAITAANVAGLRANETIARIFKAEQDAAAAKSRVALRRTRAAARNESRALNASFVRARADAKSEAKRIRDSAMYRKLDAEQKQRAMKKALQIAADTAYARGQADYITWQDKEASMKKKRLAVCSDKCDAKCEKVCQPLDNTVTHPCIGNCYDECSDCTDECVSACVKTKVTSSAQLEAMARSVAIDAARASLGMTGAAEDEEEANEKMATLEAGQDATEDEELDEIVANSTSTGAKRVSVKEKKADAKERKASGVAVKAGAVAKTAEKAALAALAAAIASGDPAAIAAAKAALAVAKVELKAAATAIAATKVELAAAAATTATPGPGTTTTTTTTPPPMLSDGMLESDWSASSFR